MGVWPQFLLQNSVEHQALSLHVQKSSSTVSGAFAIRGVLTKSNIELSLVDECIFGNVLSAGLGQAPARQCALLAGLPPTVVCTTINKVCSSGLKAVALGCQSISLGHSNVVVCGGTESMSNVPYYLPKARFGMKMGDGKVIDGMQHDGLYDPHFNGLMGVAGESICQRLNISRLDQDSYARRSYERVAAAYASGYIPWELCPTSVTDAKGNVSNVLQDEEFIKVSFEKFSKLNPVFDKSGTITAANASKLSDGASALLLMSGRMAKRLGFVPLARIRGYADAELAPIDFPIAPANAITRALERASLAITDVDVFEINEAFSNVPLANQQLLGLDPEKVNLFGGSVALGHPLGSSGSRILVTCLNVLRVHNKRIGCVAICNGGGGGTALIVESFASSIEN